jgi:hypothetical protein
MSSGQESDQEEFPERKPVGFVKSVIKALSGSRYMTPDGSMKSSIEDPNNAGLTGRNHGQIVSDQNSTNVDPLESREERGYVPEMSSLPMKVTKKELRYVGGSDKMSSFQAELTDIPVGSDLDQEDGVPRMMESYSDNIQTDKFSTGPPLSHSREPSHFHGGERILGMGRDVNFESDIGSSSHAFSSFSLYQPSGKSLPAGVNGLEPHPYFRNAVPDGSAAKDFDGSLSSRVGQQQSQNGTQRDAKRPKERSKDKAYKQRFSMVSTGDMGEHRMTLGQSESVPMSK